MCWLFCFLFPLPPQTCKKFSHLDGIFCLKYSWHEHRNSELHTFNEFWVLGQSGHYHRLVGGAWEVVHPSFHLVVDEFWWVTLGNSPLRASCQQPWRWRQRPVCRFSWGTLQCRANALTGSWYGSLVALDLNFLFCCLSSYYSKDVFSATDSLTSFLCLCFP